MAIQNGNYQNYKRKIFDKKAERITSEVNLRNKTDVLHQNDRIRML